MIAIVDYGVGNLFSLKCSLENVGADAVVSSDEKTMMNAEKIILPGVGAFGDAIDKLRATGLDRVVCNEAGKGKPLLGICLGMQLLFDNSYEYGTHTGLGLIPGKVKPISDVIPAGYKIPHIGWNALHFVKSSPLFTGVAEGQCVYFVHSFYGADCNESTLAVTEYGVPLTAAVANKNIMGCQFHPEKSGKTGLAILRAFAEMKEKDIC